MPCCGSRNCHHCFPPGAEERRVLDEAIDDIDSVIRYAPGTDWSSHEHEHEPWFHALALAYRAGAAEALRAVRAIRERFDK